MRTFFTKVLTSICLCLLTYGLSAQVYVRVNSPAEIAGVYKAAAAAFGPAITSEVTMDLVYPSDTLACAVPVEDLTGVGAMTFRGTCGYWNKAVNVQTANAIGMINANHGGVPVDSLLINIMGAGANDPAAVTIPCAQVSQQTWYAWHPYFTAPINASIVPGAPGDFAELAIEVAEGMNMATGPVAPSATHYPDAYTARWYKYTCVNSGPVVISSCGNPQDTRLFVHDNAIGNIIKENDDCDAGNNDYGSGTSFEAVAGHTYYFEWDDHWEASDFMFIFAFPALTAGAGDNCANAEEVVPGAITAASLVYPSATGSENIVARWYKYTATVPGNITISSCGGGTDTRVTLYSGDCDNLVYIADNDDYCSTDDIGSDTYASEIGGILAEAGTTYYIEWDDSWSTDGFNWNFIFEPLTTPVNITLQVDMSSSTVSADGVHVAGSFNSWTPGASMMDDSDGDGVYSFTISVLPGESVQYKFINGNAWGSDEGVPAECGVDNGLGGFNRQVVGGATDETIPAVCFGACVLCPQFECNPAAIICDGFDNYALGAVGPNADFWTTWSGTEGGAEDGIVTNELSSSGPNSMKIEGTGTQDVVLKLGEVSTGAYELRWKIYVPDTHTAYYNLQNTEVPGTQWNYEIYFDAGAADTGRIVEGQATVASFPYVNDSWMDVVQRFDLDNDINQIWINGALVHTQYVDYNLGGIDFFSAAATNLYYIDEVQFIAVGAQDCNPNAIICDGLEFYQSGSAPGAQAPWWNTWTLNPGGTDDGLVSSSVVASGNNSLEISFAGGDDVMLQLGNLTSGHYALNWKMYVPAGFGAYYNVQKDGEVPGDEFGIQVNMPVDGSFALDAGVANAATGTYPHDTWFNVEHDYDLDNDILKVKINGVDVITTTCSNQANAVGGLNQLGGVDFFGNTGNLYYVDDIELLMLEPVILNRTVTLTVDLQALVNTGMAISPDGVHIAGSFQSEAGMGADWTPLDGPMTPIAGTNMWTVTFTVPDGSYEYKFLNGNAWGTDESVEGDCSSGPFGNRALTVAGADIDQTWCFDMCVEDSCIIIGTNNAFASAFGLAPNPARSETVMTYNFGEMGNLTLNVYNAVGQKVVTRNLGNVAAGTEVISLEGMANGMYFVEMTNGINRASKRLVVQK